MIDFSLALWDMIPSLTFNWIFKKQVCFPGCKILTETHFSDVLMIIKPYFNNYKWVSMSPDINKYLVTKIIEVSITVFQVSDYF